MRVLVTENFLIPNIPLKGYENEKVSGGAGKEAE
jgi:hypothetical protein